jgi:phage terminase small subunit
MAELTPKQKKFCLEYLKDLNGMRSYRVAYPGIKNNETAKVNASKLLTKTNIQTFISEKQQKIADKVEIQVSDIVRELKNIAFSNGTDFANTVEKKFTDKKIDEDGNETEVEKTYQVVELVNTNDISQEKQSAISCVKNTKNGISIETHDKMKALELLGKHLGMFGEKEPEKKAPDNGLIEALKSGGAVWNDVSEIQQEAINDNDLVDT